MSDEAQRIAEEVAETVETSRRTFRLLIDKADEMDRLLEIAGMTWDQYRQLPRIEIKGKE